MVVFVTNDLNSVPSAAAAAAAEESAIVDNSAARGAAIIAAFPGSALQICAAGLRSREQGRNVQD